MGKKVSNTLCYIIYNASAWLQWRYRAVSGGRGQACVMQPVLTNLIHISLSFKTPNIQKQSVVVVNLARFNLYSVLVNMQKIQCHIRKMCCYLIQIVHHIKVAYGKVHSNQKYHLFNLRVWLGFTRRARSRIVKTLTTVVRRLFNKTLCLPESGIDVYWCLFVYWLHTFP